MEEVLEALETLWDEMARVYPDIEEVRGKNLEQVLAWLDDRWNEIAEVYPISSEDIRTALSLATDESSDDANTASSDVVICECGSDDTALDDFLKTFHIKRGD